MRNNRAVDTTRAILILGIVLALVQASSLLLGPLGLGLDFPRLGGWVPEGLYLVHAQGELAEPPSVGIDLSTEQTADGTVDASTGLPAVELSGPYTAVVNLLQPSRTEQIAYVSVRAFTAILIAVILWVLLRIVSSIRTGTPFTASNANRVRALAGLVAIGGTFASMANAQINNTLIQGSAAADSFFSAATLSLEPLLIGLLLAVLWVTWSRGVALEADTQGLV